MKKLLMIFTMLMAASVFAALPDGGPYKETVDGVEWTFMISGGEASLGTDSLLDPVIPESTTGAIAIPSTLGGCTVTRIGDFAFVGGYELWSVMIPNSVTSIGDSAFNGCYWLTSVTIPNSVTSIGEGAFGNCDGLTSVTIPSSVTSIGNGAFSSCEGLVEILVALDNVHYASVDGMLFNKAKTEIVVCPPGSKSGHYAIPSGVTSIGDYAFSDCSGLTSVTIPSSVTSIGMNAFFGCWGLTSVTIPSGVTCIGGSAFSACEWLAEILVASDNDHYASVDGVLFNKSKTDIVAYPCGKSGQHYTIPSSVTSIGEGAFGNCDGLTSVTIPSSVTSIGNGAFIGCQGLTSMTIPSSVTSIGRWAFTGCEALKTVYVAKGDTKRVKKMLEECSIDLDMSKVKFVEKLDPAPGPEEAGFAKAHTFNGLVTDEFGMCGMIQVATAKKSAKGEVKVSGFVMLEDGKKQTLKAVSGKVSGGAVSVTTKVGKTSLSLTITDDGFTGTLGEMAVASAEIGEETGIISGTLKMSYFDAKTGKVKTKNITIKGLADGEAADISATVKGQGEKFFRAEIVE